MPYQDSGDTAYLDEVAGVVRWGKFIFLTVSPDSDRLSLSPFWSFFLLFKSFKVSPSFELWLLTWKQSPLSSRIPQPSPLSSCSHRTLRRVLFFPFMIDQLTFFIQVIHYFFYSKEVALWGKSVFAKLALSWDWPELLVKLCSLKLSVGMGAVTLYWFLTSTPD